MGVSRLAACLWTAPSMRRTFILDEERWFSTYVIDALGALNDCYIGDVLNEGYVDLKRELTERY